MRLIDADLAKQKIVDLEHEPDYQHEDEDWSVGLCMAESVLDEVPNAAEELINEIYLGVRRECVDEDGSFMPGPFMNLMLDIKQKYGVK